VSSAAIIQSSFLCLEVWLVTISKMVGWVPRAVCSYWTRDFGW
jgi:hypothetical protein